MPWSEVQVDSRWRSCESVDGQTVSGSATMVQLGPKLWQPWITDEARSYAKCKELPLTTVSGGKWRRERRPRAPPDYPGEPLDMSTRRPRGSPPSYSQSLCHIRRPTVITSSPPTTPTPTHAPPATRQPPPVTEEGGVCDPVIDEHFRRSLGKDYMSVFTENGQPRSHTTNPATSHSVHPDTTPPSPSSLSVDDHFAKALGDTWLKLQRGESTAELRHRTDSAVTI